MTIATRLFSICAALAATASSVMPMVHSVGAATPARAGVVTRDAKGAPILLARMVVTATPL